jgi:hypothetical protein
VSQASSGLRDSHPMSAWWLFALLVKFAAEVIHSLLTVQLGFFCHTPHLGPHTVGPPKPPSSSPLPCLLQAHEASGSQVSHLSVFPVHETGAFGSGDICWEQSSI